MIFLLSANAALILHLTFILFALLGGMLTIRLRWMPMLHLPAATWGVFVELTGRICPLTYLENYFLLKAGQSGYSESFIEHYLLDVIYPSGLTLETQFILAGLFLAFNAAIYGWLLYHIRKSRTDA